jgi:hypothetical protein
LQAQVAAAAEAIRAGAAFSDYSRNIDMSQFEQNMVLLISMVLFGAIIDAGFYVRPAVVAALSRCTDVNVEITAMWSMRVRAASLRNRLRSLCLRRLSAE